MVLLRLPRVFGCLRQVRSARDIERRVAFSANVLRSLRRLGCVFKEILRSITPVLRVSVSDGVLFVNVTRRVSSVLGVFFKAFLRLLHAIFRQAFTGRISSTTANVLCPIRQDVTICGSRRFRFVGRVTTNYPITSRLRNFGLAIQRAHQDGLCPICFWVLRRRANGR